MVILAARSACRTGITAPFEVQRLALAKWGAGHSPWFSLVKCRFFLHEHVSICDSIAQRACWLAHDTSFQFWDQFLRADMKGRASGKSPGQSGFLTLRRGILKKLLTIVAMSTALWAASAAQAAPVRFSAVLTGPAEAPPNASPGTGSAVVFFDTAAHTMRVMASFTGLVPFTLSGAASATTAAHIHCCTALADAGAAGVATQTPSFAGFPLGVSSGSFDTTFDMTQAASYRAGFIAANGGTAAFAEEALYQGLLDGKAYFNIHTNAFPGGEIRGFLHQVPEPGSLALLGLGLVGLAGMQAKRRESRPELACA